MRIVKMMALMASVMLLGACGKGIVSPDGSLRAEIDGQTVSVYYFDEGVSGDGKLLAVSVHLGLITEEDDLDSGLVLKKAAWKWKVNEDYMMVAGKRKHCHNEAYERVYTYSNPDGKVLDVILRLYNDGVAIRYKLPDGTVVTDDCTAYSIPDGVKRWISPLKTDYESFFPLATDGGPTKERMWPRPAPGAWAFPALAEPSEGVFALISEADLRHGDSAASLDNSADSETYKLKLTGPTAFHGGESPWRVAIIGSLSDIVESTLITDLSTPAEFDADWVEPGVSSWVYWAYNHGSKDFQLDKSFIDLAADLGWPYCLIDWEWPEMENGGDITDLLAYAREKGVKINLWYNSGTSWIGEGAPQPQDRLLEPERREQELSWLEGLGVSGIKVDFFLPDNAEMVDYYLDILEDAARHHLMVDFHGCTIPRGWQRTGRT
ncbi:MAG: glycoside hydrolase family 97 N-terminal domain-containing protein [Bacteroidales bacterium]|nr:glycoside hydrolase family 97 N-terminal domain-containing protein [Bacteroidales bacterium]